MHEFKRAFAGQPSDWPRYELHQVAERVTTRNASRNNNVLTISAQHGLVSQSEFFNRRVASADLRNYYLIERGDFAYNKSYSSGYPFGVVRRLERYGVGVVSPLYICFRPDSERTDSNFLAHYFEAGILEEGLGLVAKEGIRNHGLLNVAVGDFFGLQIAVPPLPEQRQIAEVLDTLDEAIRKTEQIIAKLQQMKQGLLHDLLTRGIDDNGELRDPDRHPEQFKDSPLGRIPKGWDVDCLEALTARRIVDGVHHTPTYVAQGVPFLTVENLTRGPGISLTPCRYVSERAHREYFLRADPRPGDVLVSKDGTLGVARIVPEGFPEASIFVSVALLRPRPDRILPGIIREFFETHWFHRQLGTQSAGTGLKHIHLEHFRAFRLAVPPLVEQRHICERISALEAVSTREQEQLSKLRLLKSGLMEDLLTGRVRVTKLLEQAAE